MDGFLFLGLGKKSKFHWQLYVNFSSCLYGNVQLQLQSVLGNEVDKTFFRYKAARTLTLPVETLMLKPGVYWIEISLGKGVLRKKWIKL